jgi:hypothetical protein
MSNIKVNVNSQNLTSIRVGQQNATKVVSSLGGLQGTQGTQGTQGLQGLQGIYGPQGSQGIIGPVGSNAGRLFYFAKQSSDISGYYKALEYPSLSGISSTTVQVTQTPVLINRFVTEINSPAVTSIPVGENTVLIHTVINNDPNYPLANFTVVFNCIISKCSADGTGITTITSSESSRFSAKVNTEFTWDVAIQNAVVVEPSDRIIFEIYATRFDTSSPGSVLNLRVDYEGQRQGYVRTTVSAGAIGPQGVQGLQGLQGLIGPVAGSNTQVLFNNNNVSAGSTNFVYDASNQRVGIGTTNPTSTLTVIGSSLITGISTVGLGTTSTPPNNSQMSFELTSDTNLRIKVRGSDGILRSANITLS